jgi:hypothetical protein
LPYGVYEQSLRELERIAREYILITVPRREVRINVTCPYCGCGFEYKYHMRSFDDHAMTNLFTDFAVADLQTIDVPGKHVLSPLFTWVSHRLFRYFPKTATCPQCGYHRQADSPRSSAENVSRNPLTARVKQMLPRRPWWYAALYRRRSSST